ncbi:protein ELC-like [Nymphaea colorata]|nr:protein ELC-like [Nymphaea colorata]
MVPPGYGLDSSQRSVQFLNKVLSARGPSALPYKEEVKWLIRQHLLSLLQEFPSLQVKTAVFTHNDGRTVNLLQADGTIPMLYQLVTYNIPVVIWLTEHYPRQYPCVFVNPTRDMLIRPCHAHVDPSGLVSVPYMQSWTFPSSNLVDLARNMSLLFGRDPPLYTKQPAPVAHRIQNQYQGSASSTTVRRPSSPSPSSAASDHPPPSVRPSNVAPPTPPYGRTVPPSPQRPNTDDPSEVLKKKLLEMLHSDTVALRKSREEETDSLVRAQPELKRRGRQIDEGLRQMIDEKEGLEQLLQMVLMNTDVLETWLRENGEKNKLVIDVDDVFEPCDPLSRQMVDCTASDLAIEDTFYSLDKAMQQGVIPFDVYMRNIRALSREQFFHRATSAKIRAAQMQSVITSMASRATPYGV